MSREAEAAMQPGGVDARLAWRSRAVVERGVQARACLFELAVTHELTHLARARERERAREMLG